MLGLRQHCLADLLLFTISFALKLLDVCVWGCVCGDVCVCVCVGGRGGMDGGESIRD